VSWRPWSGTPWDPEKLAEILGVDLEAEDSNATNTVHGEPVEVDKLPAWLRRRLDDETKPKDASEAFHGLVGACKDARLNQGQTVTVVGSWRHLPDRYTRRIAARVGREVPLVGPAAEARALTVERARAIGVVRVDGPTRWAAQLRVPVELVVDVESSFSLPEADP
jgi:hypothetical protein